MDRYSVSCDGDSLELLIRQLDDSLSAVSHRCSACTGHDLSDIFEILEVITGLNESAFNLSLTYHPEREARYEACDDLDDESAKRMYDLEYKENQDDARDGLYSNLDADAILAMLEFGMVVLQQPPRALRR